MSDLDFIKDGELRKTLEDSFEYVLALYTLTKDPKQSEIFRNETYRVIIIYVVSFIEAVLLYRYREGGVKFKSYEYKYIQSLVDEYKHIQKPNSQVVIAVQENVEKKDHQIGLNDLVILFKKNKVLKAKTADNILDINEIRNTLHFNKPRTKNFDLNMVNKALQLIIVILGQFSNE